MNVEEVERASDEEVDAFLEHFGVLGMHWGVRNPRNRELNRASRQKDRRKHENEVLRARAKLKSGRQTEEWIKAKDKFHRDKERIGSREARKALNKVRQKHYAEIQKSQEAANGKEAAITLLAVAGLVGITAFAAAKSEQNRSF